MRNKTYLTSYAWNIPEKNGSGAAYMFLDKMENEYKINDCIVDNEINRLIINLGVNSRTDEVIIMMIIQGN